MDGIWEALGNSDGTFSFEDKANTKEALPAAKENFHEQKLNNYIDTHLDENYCNKMESLMDISRNIPQLDGNISDEEPQYTKAIFSINCDTEPIVHVISFFRSLMFIWDSLSCHALCSEKSSQKRFFCHMRSSSIRLAASRVKGPKSLKMLEVVSQLDQLEIILGWKWKKEIENIPKWINKILSLLQQYESKLLPLFDIPTLSCNICEKKYKTHGSLSTQNIYCSH